MVFKETASREINQELGLLEAVGTGFESGFHHYWAVRVSLNEALTWTLHTSVTTLIMPLTIHKVKKDKHINHLAQCLYI